MEFDRDKLESKLKKLEWELKISQAKLKACQLILVIPIYIFIKSIFGKRTLESFKDLHSEIVEIITKTKELKFQKIIAQLHKQSPLKVYNLLESLFLWKFRDKIYFYLFYSIVLALPTVFLIQQNLIMKKQTVLLESQTKYFEKQTDLLEVQSVDNSITRSIADFKVLYRVDFPQIKRIASKFKELDLVRPAHNPK